MRTRWGMMAKVGRFIADEMLIRLARWLRMAGQDVSRSPEGAGDSDLIEVALKEERTLLTRDRVLSQRCEKAGAGCLLIRSSDLDAQLSEFSAAGFSLEPHPERCTLCNGPLEEAVGPEKADDAAGSEEGSIHWRCQRCGKIYWRGSHWRGIRERLEGKRG